MATEYTYDGDGNVLTCRRTSRAGPTRQTAYVYGVSTATGSAVNSNDILAAVQYPDPTTGNPSASQQDTYTVNALGQVTQYDRPQRQRPPVQLRRAGPAHRRTR